MRGTTVALHMMHMMIAATLVLSACHGSSSEPAQPNSQSTTAVLKLSTLGTLPADEKIGAIDITVALAPGVSLKTASNTAEPASGVVTPSGVAATNSLIVANYSSPTSTQTGKVRIGLINVSGFGTGEFATINGDIAAGKNPQASEFSVISSAVSSLTGSILTGLTSGFTLDIR